MNWFGKFFKKIFGSRNDRLIKQYRKTIEVINGLEPQWKSLSDEALQAKTNLFRTQLFNQESEAVLLPQIFATVREASRRVLNMRHFDVQLIGGLALHEGKIAEMRTGEGKTLVATLPAYLNALYGKGVHIVTVNDYLAKRDADWMQPLYQFLGLSVGVIQAGLTAPERRQAYAADITYGTNNEFGFDYLRDNMVLSIEEQTQRSLHYAIVDEVDSILIDEARTPLIISGPAEESSEYYYLINEAVTSLQKGEAQDFTLDEKRREAYLTEQGHQKVEEKLLNIGLLKQGENPYSAEHINLMYHVTAALKARYLFRRDVDYIVKANQAVIVDEHTGRLMSGRRWSDGLHQAVEAKEGIPVQPENQTLASITFQNYFRLYSKLAGMTGTADTEAYEFHQIYGLEVVVVPTNKSIQRLELTDKIYLTTQEKWQAIVEDIKQSYIQKRPVLAGTASIENSERLSDLLDQQNIPHQILNAKRHEQEAKIIAEAGRPGAITIATNMAGRGTDIILGGNLNSELSSEVLNEMEIAKRRAAWEERYQFVVEKGGLYTIGTERHEARRIDNQFSGRGGRQGDPGASRFYASLEDHLLRIFAPERLSKLMKWLGMQPGEAIEHTRVNRAIENAQRQVEQYHFDMRKQLLEYDDVANEQRKIIYQQRQSILETQDIQSFTRPLWEDVITTLISSYISFENAQENWNILGLVKKLEKDFDLKLPIVQWLKTIDNEKQLVEETVSVALKNYEVKLNALEQEHILSLEKTIVLQTLDHLWKEHLVVMDHLKQGIHFRGYAQKEPKQEYKRESFELFAQLLEDLKYQVVSLLSKVDLKQFAPNPEPNLQLDAGYATIGRNETCPCGSNKKFKYCHGKLV